MKITIIGLGLIGGSFALCLREKGVAQHIAGVDASPENAAKALEMGLIDRVVPFEEATNGADLVVLAAPVNAIPTLAVKVLNRIKPCQIAMDMGSTKGELGEMIALHPNRSRFVLTHPMWGTEKSGPEAARSDAFAGRAVVICDGGDSAPEAVRTVEEIYTRIGMTITHMTSEEQDIHTAYVSHISHITAYALALTVMEKERSEGRIFELASGGFESTVRLAKSSPSMWAPIFVQNKYNVLDVLRELIHQLQIFRRLLEKDDLEGITAAITKANEIKRII
ncbi:MAG: prephenate dehydrogenase [Rikenellaceae bacterium]|jgi:prephenate dehydrogenase|nr:prephenate dehydrogenase [Rikenellaceae bacterium]